MSAGQDAEGSQPLTLEMLRAELRRWATREADPGHRNTPETSHAARVSAARGLVAIRRRTGRPIPDDVLRLAEQG